tara:strand:+ start:21854 stop:23614 length:1761 start_codon:yes stop_codon:yes gene_type:complete
MAAASLQDVIDKLSANQTANDTHATDIKAGQDEDLIVANKTLKALNKIFNLQTKIHKANAEALREQARIKGTDEEGDIPDGAKEEKKAGGFFSRMGKAIMNPVGAMGKSMSKMGKGIEGFLKGLARGLAAFANPMILVGVTVMSLTLPIFAAGLAAAFKVFEMIAGEGKALKIITGIILALGEAIGTILQKVLEGFGNMVKNMGPFIKDFFTGIAIVIEALHPIVVDIFKVLKDIITDPVFNATIQKVLDTVGIALQEISAIIQKTGDVIIAVMENVDKILTSIFDGISKVIKTIGDTIATVIDSIVDGIERLAGLDAGNMAAVAGGLALLAGGLAMFSVGAMVAGAAMPSSEDLERIAKSVDRFGKIESENLAPVGKGMQEIGEGLYDFGLGGKIASLVNDPKGLEAVAASVTKFGKIDATNFAMVGTGMQAIGEGLKGFGVGGFVSGLAEGFGKWIGASDPVEKFQKFAAIGPGLSQAGMGVTALANAFDAFDGDNLEKIGNGLDKFLGATDMAKLKEFSAATEGLVSGQMLAQLQVQTAQAAATGRPLIIQTNNTSQVNTSGSTVIGGSSIKTDNGDASSRLQ